MNTTRHLLTTTTILLVIHTLWACETGLQAEDPRIGLDDLQSTTSTDTGTVYTECPKTNSESFSEALFSTLYQVDPDSPTSVTLKLVDWDAADLEGVVLDVVLYHSQLGPLWTACGHTFDVQPGQNTIPLGLLQPGIYTAGFRLVARDNCDAVCSDVFNPTIHVVPPVVAPTISVDAQLGEHNCASVASTYVAGIDWPQSWLPWKTFATIESTWEIYDTETDPFPTFTWTFTDTCPTDSPAPFPCSLSADNYLTGKLTDISKNSMDFLDPGDVIVLKSRLIVGDYQAAAQPISIEVNCNQEPDFAPARPVTLSLKEYDFNFPGCAAYATWKCNIDPDVWDPDFNPAIINSSKPKLYSAYTDIAYEYTLRKKNPKNSPEPHDAISVIAQSPKTCAQVTIGKRANTDLSLNPTLECADLGNLNVDFAPEDSLECVVRAFNPDLEMTPRPDMASYAMASTKIPHPWTHIYDIGIDPELPENPRVGVTIGPGLCNEEPEAEKTVRSTLCCAVDASRCGQLSADHLNYSWTWKRNGEVLVNDAFPNLTTLKLHNSPIGFPSAQKGDDICCNVSSLEKLPTEIHTTCIQLQNSAPEPFKADTKATASPVTAVGDTTPTPTFNLSTSAHCESNGPPIDYDQGDNPKYYTCWFPCDESGNTALSDNMICEGAAYEKAKDSAWTTAEDLNVTKGDFVACQQFPMDEEGKSGPPTLVSTCLAVGNATPVIANTKIMTADPIPSRSAEFSCSAIGTDPDNDPLQMEYKWQLYTIDTLTGENQLLAETADTDSTPWSVIPKDLMWNNDVQPEPGQQVTCCAKAVEATTPEKATSEWLCDPAGITLDNKPATCGAFHADPDPEPLTVDGGIAWTVSGADDLDDDTVVVYVTCDYFSQGSSEQHTETFGPFTVVDSVASGTIFLSEFSPLPVNGGQIFCIADVIDVFANAVLTTPPKVGTCGDSVPVGLVTNAPPVFPNDCNVTIVNAAGVVLTTVTPGESVFCNVSCEATDSDGDPVEVKTAWRWSESTEPVPTQCSQFTHDSEAPYAIAGCYAKQELTCYVKAKDPLLCGLQILDSKPVKYQVPLLVPPTVIIQNTSAVSDPSLPPHSGDTLECVGSLPGAVSYQYQWSDLDTNVLGQDHTLFLDSDTCWVNKEIHCKSTAFSDCDNAQSNATAITVGTNYVPHWDQTANPEYVSWTVIGGAPSPTVLDTLRCELDTALLVDPDYSACGDSQKPTFSSYLEILSELGTPIGKVQQQGSLENGIWTTDFGLPAIKKGQQVRCCTTASDSITTSDVLCSVPMTIQNANPHAPTAVTVTDNPWDGEVYCKYETSTPADPDSDEVKPTYTFLIDGEPTPESADNSTVLPPPIQCGTEVSCSVRLSDPEGGQSPTVSSSPTILKGGGSLWFTTAADAATAQVSLPQDQGSISFWMFVENTPTEKEKSVMLFSANVTPTASVLSLEINPNATLRLAAGTSAITSSPVPTNQWAPVIISWTTNTTTKQTFFKLWTDSDNDPATHQVSTTMGTVPAPTSSWPQLLTWYGSSNSWALDEIVVTNTAPTVDSGASMDVSMYTDPTPSTIALWHISHLDAKTANTISFPDFPLVANPNGPTFTRASVMDECLVITNSPPPAPIVDPPKILSGKYGEGDTSDQWSLTVQCQVTNPTPFDVDGDPVSYQTLLQEPGEDSKEVTPNPDGQFTVTLSPKTCKVIRCGAYAKSLTPGNEWLQSTTTQWSDTVVVTHSLTDANCGAISPCQTASCGEGGACNVQPNTGASCEDGDKCTVGDLCNDVGGCQPGTSPCPVSTDVCTTTVCNTNDGSCLSIPTSEPCDDGDPCTLDDTCKGGICTGKNKVCASVQCQVGKCNNNNGECEYSPDSDASGTTQCTSSDPCSTSVGTCQSDGTCLGTQICCGATPTPPQLKCGQDLMLDSTLSTNKTHYYGPYCSSTLGTPEATLQVTAAQWGTTPTFAIATSETNVPTKEKPTLLLLGPSAGTECKTQTCSAYTDGWLAPFKPNATHWFVVEGATKTTVLDNYSLGYLCPTTGGTSCSPWTNNAKDPWGTTTHAQWFCGPNSLQPVKTACQGDLVNDKFSFFGTFEYKATDEPTTLWALQSGKAWIEQPRMVVVPKTSLSPTPCPSPPTEACSPTTGHHTGPWTKDKSYCVHLYIKDKTPVLIGKTTPQSD